MLICWCPFEVGCCQFADVLNIRFGLDALMASKMELRRPSLGMLVCARFQASEEVYIWPSFGS